jgi:multidrug resistance protein
LTDLSGDASCVRVGPASGRRRTRAGRPPLPPGFGAIWTSVALDLIGFGIVLPILPLYAERFGAGPAAATGLVAAFSAAQLVSSPLWGRISDRLGRKPVLVVSLIGTCVGSLVTGLAGALWILFLGRIIDGASGGSVSVAQAAVADVAPPEQRARLMGLLGAAFGLGFVAGPAIGGLAALGGPKVPFLIAAGIAAVNTVMAIRRLPETHPGRSGVQHEPALEKIDWRRSGVAALIGVAFTSLVAFSAFEATFSLFGERRLGLKIASAGGVFAAVGIVLSLVQVRLVGPTVERFGEGGTMLIGLALDAVGLVALAAVHSWAALAPALLLLVVGQGLVTPTLSSAVAGRVGAHRRGGVLGIQQAAGGLARVVGPIAGGYLFQHAGVPVPYLVGAAVMALAALLVVSRPDLRARPARPLAPL